MTEIPEHLLKRAEQARIRNLPHSRACGVLRHEHGPDCAQDCPTCHGRPHPQVSAALEVERLKAALAAAEERLEQERALDALPEWVEFHYYLHDNYTRHGAAKVMAKSHPEVPEDVWEKAFAERPFYEVTLKCRLNTRTGEVELLEARL